MRVKLALVTSVLLVLSILGSGVASAADPKPVPHAPRGTPHAVAFSAHCSGAHPGGTIKIKAKVRHAVRGKTLTGSASAVFTGGPAAVNLNRKGHSFKLRGKLPVPASQPIGPVTVTVTIVYDGQTTTLSCVSKIHAPRPAHPRRP